MLFALPSVFWGLALSLCHRRGGWRSIANPVCSVVAALATGFILVEIRYVERSLLLENLAGMGILMVALTDRRILGTHWLEEFSPLAFGIYLSHLLVLEIVEAIAFKLAWDVMPKLDIMIFLITAVVSTLATFVLAKSPRLRWLAG